MNAKERASFVPRLLAARVEEALQDTPVVLIVGPRQGGKSTLVKAIEAPGERTYYTLDQRTVAQAATLDPEGFVASLDRVTIDEVQRAPDLLLAIKLAVDEDRRPGRFLLTGSANILLQPRVADSLAGRMEVLELWPLSVREIERLPGNFIEGVFGAWKDAPRVRPEPWLERALAGGFPEARSRASVERRDSWFEAYVTTLLERDVRDLVDLDRTAALGHLLTLLATRSGGLLNQADLARSVSLPHTTLSRYLSVLEMLFLVRAVPAWSNNRGVRLVKSPKMYVTDSGLLAHLAGFNLASAVHAPTLAGTVLEAFVLGELLRERAAAKARVDLFHFRTHSGQEVDFVLEDRAGRVVGLEIKARKSADSGDFKGLRALKELAGSKFHRGIVLYSGDAPVPFGEELWAWPISALWQLTSESKKSKK